MTTATLLYAENLSDLGSKAGEYSAYTAKDVIITRNNLIYTSVFFSQKYEALGLSDISSEIRTYQC